MLRAHRSAACGAGRCRTRWRWALAQRQSLRSARWPRILRTSRCNERAGLGLLHAGSSVLLYANGPYMPWVQMLYLRQGLVIIPRYPCAEKTSDLLDWVFHFLRPGHAAPCTFSHLPLDVLAASAAQVATAAVVPYPIFSPR